MNGNKAISQEDANHPNLPDAGKLFINNITYVNVFDFAMETTATTGQLLLLQILSIGGAKTIVHRSWCTESLSIGLLEERQPTQYVKHAHISLHYRPY